MKIESLDLTVDASAVGKPGLPTYVLITPARNEEASIEKTIQSVISQTVKPLKWVIVSDGSTDRTDDIAKQYAAEYDFIEYTRLVSKTERDFACQVYGQHAGAERLKEIDSGRAEVYPCRLPTTAIPSFPTNFRSRISLTSSRNTGASAVGNPSRSAEGVSRRRPRNPPPFIGTHWISARTSSSLRLSTKRGPIVEPGSV